LALAEELNRDRFTFEIITLEPNTPTIWTAVKNSGCTVHELDTGIPRLKEPVGMIKTIYSYYDMFRRLKPDIVQTQSGFCNQWARLAAIAARVPVVIVTVNFD
jgi:UDP-N-acetylglucosamine:LPS N-acetylglucosamine transferase